MHPKTSIEPQRTAIKKVLEAGWWGQLKIHGHRAQIHVASSEDVPILAYNRQGRLHAKAVGASLGQELRRLFGPPTGVTVIDCEWLKGSDRLFVFDVLRHQGRLLADSTYAERYALLPRVYASAHIETLGLLKTTQACLDALGSEDPVVEGLVFKAPFIRGFSDAAIVRCRRQS